MKDKLILGLDVEDVASATKLVKQLEAQINFFKIGYQLAFAGGLDLAKELVQSGKKVFLDLKLLDIDNTVYSAVENLVKIQAHMLTIHAYPHAMRAAVSAAQGSHLCLLGVTVLTSLSPSDLAEIGYTESTEELVARRAMQTRLAGMGGVVCSAQESSLVKPILGDNMAIVTPGIRLEGQPGEDQKRVMTPAKALAAGSTHLVVSRPIIKAPDPLEAAAKFFDNMQGLA